MSIGLLSSPESTGPLPVVCAPQVAPEWFEEHVLRAAAYVYNSDRLRLWLGEAVMSGDHLLAAVFGEALALRSRHRSDAAATVALLEVYWPAGRTA